VKAPLGFVETTLVGGFLFLVPPALMLVALPGAVGVDVSLPKASKIIMQLSVGSREILARSSGTV
jgi:hypothetical protein